MNYKDSIGQTKQGQGIHHISYDYFNVTTKDILLDHQPLYVIQPD